MEVLHHSHHPKKWKEYITEFVCRLALTKAKIENEKLIQLMVHE